jgi:hypothetical protein
VPFAAVPFDGVRFSEVPLWIVVTTVCDVGLASPAPLACDSTISFRTSIRTAYCAEAVHEHALVVCSGSLRRVSSALARNYARSRQVRNDLID